MKNVSTEFRKKVENGSACYAYANVVLRNGTKLTLDPSKDFRIDGNSITTNGGSSFPLGVALSRTIELNLDNYDGRFDAIDFYGAEITLFTGMTLDDGSVEKIKEGIFSVVEPTTPGSTITLVAADYMAKTSDSYVANTTFPATIFNIYRDVCIQCNLVAGSAKFTNGDFVVDAISENVTCREMLGYIAMIAGGNAMCDSNGAVIIKSYDFSGLKKSDGTYDYTKAQNFSGFQKNPSISTDMIRITGVKAENDDGDEKQSYIVGSEDYCFLIENPLISGKEAQALQLIGNVIVGLEFYTFSGDHISNPLAEFMDPCFVQDMKGNLFFSVLSNITYTYLGSTSISCDTDSPETVKSQKATSGSKVYQNLKKQQQVIKKEFEKQMDALEKQVSNAPGTYISSEVQPDGSSIYYLHDKPTLAESKSVFKITADTITASTDGGKTWNGGFSVDGVMIAKIMTAIGINFDWGVGGTLIIQDRNGKQTVYMDAETGEVRLSVVSLSIQGETVADIAEKKAESSLNDFTSNIYNPMISSLQKQIDGQIETFYYDYEPTLNNVPAKEWDTEEKKTAHEGDLFYWKSKGYAYRFQKDGSAWNWQLVQDTDITLAMQKAAEAKDTADSKRRVFTATPYPPYDVGDLWVGNDTSDLMRCQRSRQSGAYDSSDWIKAVKYTDDSELNNFIYTDYAETLVEISNSIDKKAETWYQTTDPSLQWTGTTEEALLDHTGATVTDNTGAAIMTVIESEKMVHDGDLWKNPSTNKEYIYQAGIWHEMSIPNDVFDIIDGKAQIFVSQPKPPYSIGDLWFSSATSDILTCVVARESGSYVASDWQKRNKYTDDSAVDALDKALTQLEIFNRLTNNGAAQGLFLKDGKLYLNFSYAQGGTLKLGGVNNGNGQAEVYDSSGNKIGSWNKDGFNLQKGSIYGTQIHLESQNDYIQGTVNGNEAVKISTGGVKVDSTANWGLGVTRKEYIFEMNPYLFPGVRLLDRSTGAGIGSTWTSGHFGMCYTDDLSGYSSVTDSLSNYGVYMKAGKEDANGGFYAIGNGLGKGSHVTAEGIYTSGTKNRIVDTENYGQRLQYCYEMPSPFFGDIGKAETDENGLCYVQIDDIFGETVLRNDKYNVFLQKEGCGDLWIEEKTADYFLVKGTPNLSFSWELKAKQADYTLERLEKNEAPYEKEPELDYSEIGYQTYIDYVESKIIA
jgi:hypothetical protein